jgi:outer membrane protein assembly factor BamA
VRLPAIRRAAVALILLASLSAGARAQDAPVLKAVEIDGASLFTRADVLRTLRLKPGAPLRRAPEALAALLEDRYRVRGLPAASVRARFDVASGTLRLTVDEGRVASVEIEGLSEADSRRVRETLAIEPGTVLRDAEVSSGLRRLRDVSEGAFDTVDEPPYSIERGADGARVRMKLVRRALAIRPVLFGPIMPAPLFTRVDGWALPFGAEATLFDHAAFDHLNVYAIGAYGLSSERARFALGARKPVFGRRRLVLGYELHDLTDADDFFRVAGLERWPGTPIYFDTFEDYYRRRGHEAYAFWRPSPNLHAGVSYRADRFQSLPVEVDADDVRPNPPVADGRMRSLLLTGRWSWDNGLSPDWTAERDSFLLRSLQGDLFQRDQAVRAEGTLEVADADALGGDFTFKRFVGQLRGARRVSAHQTLFGRVLLGRSGGDLPPQRRFALGGEGALRGRPTKAYQGDQVALVTVEHAYEPLRWPAVIAFYEGGRTSSDVGSSGWKSDLGIGLAWPPGGRRLGRIDVGFPVGGRVPGESKARVTGHILLPF